MKLMKSSKAILLSSIFALGPVFAQTPYDEGQKALRAQQWMQAARQFELAAEATDATSEDVAAAMYWRARALFQAGHQGDAARQLAQLKSRYPGSRWIAEAKALEAEHNSSIDHAAVEDEYRLFALSQLLERDLERALPLVLEIMRNTSSEKVRRDALFVLGMSNQPEALAVIAETAKDSSQPELQAEAIGILGVSASPESLTVLEGLYASTSDSEVKSALLHAYSISGNAQMLVDILGNETDVELQMDILHSLGAMQAVEALQKVYPDLESTEMKLAAIEAMGIAGDVDSLSGIIDSETHPELRARAIQGIAMHGGADAAEQLRTHYASATTIEEKRAVLESLVVLEDGGTVALEIVRTEQDPELLELAIYILGMQGQTDTLKGLYSENRDPETRQALIHALAMSGAVATLKEVIEEEDDPQLLVSAIHGIAMSGDGEAGTFLQELYAKSDSAIRMAVIESLLVLDSPATTIQLLESESDPTLRRQLLQNLSMMDSEEGDEYLFKMLESSN